MPILVLSQLNNSPEKRDDHRPMLSDLREYGNIIPVVFAILLNFVLYKQKLCNILFIIKKYNYV